MAKENSENSFQTAATDVSANKKKDYFVEGTATPEQAEFLHRVLDVGFDFMNGKARDNLVLRYADNATLKALVAEPLPQKGTSLDSILEIIQEKILPYSIAQSDPRFLAFPDTGNSTAGLAADLLTPFCNQNMIAVDRSAPIATFVETQVLLWLRQLAGFSAPKLDELRSLDQIGGMWTPGGNLSNYTSILGALHRRFPNIRRDGLWSLKKCPVIIVARGIDHFSFSNAAVVLGLGSQGILWTDANENYQMDTSALRNLLKNCPDHLEPFAVVSSAGNCRTTSIDNLKEIRSICDEHNLWMHVDGCHGGSLLFSPKLKAEMLPGIEHADSISLDPHKGLFVAYPASYVLFRDPETFAALARFPERTKEEGLFDLGLITPFLGSRGFHSLKMWMLIKHLGLDGLAEAIESRQETNHTMVDMLKQTDLFVMFNESQFYRQVFVFCPKPILDTLQSSELTVDQQNAARSLINSYSSRFNSSLYKSGEIVFDGYQMNDIGNHLRLGTKEKYSVFGMSIGQAHIAPQMMASIDQRIRTVGAEFAEQMIKDFAAIHLPVGANPARPVILDEAKKPEGPAGW